MCCFPSSTHNRNPFTMIRQTLAALLISGVVFSGRALAEGTNETSDLFGTTVTHTRQLSQAEAQFNRGSAYLTGEGVEKDAAKAIECFMKSAELGYPQAQFNLGLCYMNGTGVEQSDKDAAKWFKHAAEQGLKEAYFPLGICYYNLAQYTEAYAWALFADADGDSRLQEMLDPLFSEEEIAAGKKHYEEMKAAAEKKTEKTD